MSGIVTDLLRERSKIKDEQEKLEKRLKELRPKLRRLKDKNGLSQNEQKQFDNLDSEHQEINRKIPELRRRRQKIEANIRGHKEGLEKRKREITEAIETCKVVVELSTTSPSNRRNAASNLKMHRKALAQINADLSRLNR